MRNKVKRFSFVFSLVLLLVLPQEAFAYNWAKETSAGIPSLTTPLFVPDTTAPVSSSWNEPRPGTDAPHKGVDQSVGGSNNYRNVGPMWLGGSGVIFQQGNAGDCGGGNYQVIKYVSSGTTFYSLFMHLFDYNLKKEGDIVFASDVSARTGASGTFNCPLGAAYHLHFEVLSSYSYNGLGSRVSVNPANYVSISISNQFTVFKNYTYTSSGPVRNISIAAIDYSNGGPDILTIGIIYYRQSGTGPWSGPFNMTGPPSSGNWTYSLFTNNVAYDVLIAGRRKDTEYWSTYPAQKTFDNVGKAAGLPITSFTDWVPAKVF
jgi:hypothetical protein